MGSLKSNHFLFISLLSSLASGLSSSIPREFSILTQLDELDPEERVAELFQQWKEKHRKVYKSAQEAEKRLENFRCNLKYVFLYNSASAGHALGLNKFADTSNEEFRQVYTPLKRKKPFNRRMKNQVRDVQRKNGAISCEISASLDWRKSGIVTGVKDQSQCGSCWAFSSTGAIEGKNALATGDLISLSEQELIDCDSTNYGCEGGIMDYAFEWVIENGGIDTESDYPYTGIDGNCSATKEKSKVVSIDGYTDVEEEERALLCAVVKQPVSVWMVGSSLDFQLYTGGIHNGECSSNPDDIDHAVLIVGYGSEGDGDYWIIKNSWGTSWVIEGYAYIRRNTKLKYGVCAINSMASYPTKESSSPSPFPSPSPGAPLPLSPSPPPPSPPLPSDSGDFSHCAAHETCCRLYEIYDFCLIYGCCAYENAVCCEGTEYCRPREFPICDVDEGLCLEISSQSSANLYITCTLGRPLGIKITGGKGFGDRYYSDDQVNCWYT